MMRMLIATLGVALLGAGCVHSVFPTPVHVSTRSGAVGETESLGKVTVTQCAVLVAIIPVLDPWNP
ncbi:MAG: hypothetical protein AAFU79_34420, partial [Myxococcota bacterium]